MVWPFGKKPREGWRDKPQAITSAIPRDDDRVGPVPPPPPTAHAPGVAVYAFGEIPAPRLLRLADGTGGFFFEGEEGKERSSALLVLEPGGAAGPGDVLLFSPSSSFEEISKSSPRPSHHIRRDDLSGRGVSGITGLRSRHAGGGITVLRFGPPPGARWVFVGLHAIAVFAGKVTLVDAEESRVVSAGQIALVGDPTATLYVEAGNDSALAVALGGAHVVSALG
ncbi:MAG: hypothetical protein IPL89_01000 [Acidobacteria bacterium]|nr:hypothetical protein [Acidobacteriota bacterium]